MDRFKIEGQESRGKRKEKTEEEREERKWGVVGRYKQASDTWRHIRIIVKDYHDSRPINHSREVILLHRSKRVRPTPWLSKFEQVM